MKFKVLQIVANTYFPNSTIYKGDRGDLWPAVYLPVHVDSNNRLNTAFAKNHDPFLPLFMPQKKLIVGLDISADPLPPPIQIKLFPNY